MPWNPGLETSVAVRVQPRQLAFALPHAESLTRDNFLEGPANEAALALIESWPDWPNRIMLLVGPEGGWSEEELQAAEDAGLALAQLGPYRLRSETAGVVAAARARAALEISLRQS